MAVVPEASEGGHTSARPHHDDWHTGVTWQVEA